VLTDEKCIAKGFVSVDIKNTPKKKVLFIGPYPPPYAGPEMGMKLFLESSLRHTFQIHFLKTNVRKTNVNKGRFDYHIILAFFRFPTLLVLKILYHRPVLVYYPNTATLVGWLGRDVWCLLICRFFRIKCVIHLRGGHFKINFEKFPLIAKRLIRIACGSVSLALVQAECMRNQFEGLVPTERIKVLYNAIDTRKYDNHCLNDYDHQQVLFMGHMTKAKGYCDLVRAISLVADKLPDVKFYFAGSLHQGGRNVLYDQMTGLPLTNENPYKVHQSISSGPYKTNYLNLGIVSGNEKLNLLRKTNIFVLPSYSEGFSRAILEAMSMGKPVIYTPVGAHQEVLQDGVNGFLVRPGDIKQLANRIIQLLSDVSLRK